MKNYYQILEVSENASLEVIEKAYKVLARKYHPDTYPKDKVYFAESKFKEITEAYEVLSNKEARREYDIRIGLNNIDENEYSNSNNYQYQKEPEQKADTNNSKFKKLPSFKKYASTISGLIKDEAKKPAEERSRDFTAAILTIIIISILVFVFWKVPFLHNIIFP